MVESSLETFVTTTTWMSFSIGVIMLGLVIAATLIIVIDTEISPSISFVKNTDHTLSVDDHVGVVVSANVRTDLTVPAEITVGKKHKVVNIETGDQQNHVNLYGHSDTVAFGFTVYFGYTNNIMYKYKVGNYGENITISSTISLGSSTVNGRYLAIGKNYAAIAAFSISSVLLYGVDLTTFSPIGASASSTETSFTTPSLIFFKDSDQGFVYWISYSGIVYTKGFQAGNPFTLTTTRQYIPTSLASDANPSSLILDETTCLIIEDKHARFVTADISTGEVTVGPAIELPCLIYVSAVVNYATKTIGFIGTGSLSNARLRSHMVYMCEYTTDSITYSGIRYPLDAIFNNLKGIEFDRRSEFTREQGLNIITRDSKGGINYNIIIKVGGVTDVLEYTRVYHKKLIPLRPTAATDHIDFLVGDGIHMVKGFFDKDYRQIFTSDTYATRIMGQISAVSGDNVTVENLIHSKTHTQSCVPGFEYYYDHELKTTSTNSPLHGTHVGQCLDGNFLITKHANDGLLI
jgi:hypothetical protein